jgi:phage tail tape-measure protein
MGSGTLVVHDDGRGEQLMDESDKEHISKTAGMSAGMLGGAKLGQVVLPIPVVGPFAGAVLGGVVGSELGKRFGKALINGASAFVDTIKDTRPTVAPDDEAASPAG